MVFKGIQQVVLYMLSNYI